MLVQIFLYDRKIHRKGVFRPDLRLRSGQGISSPHVVSRIGRKFASRTHAQNGSIREDAAAPWAICRAAAA